MTIFHHTISLLSQIYKTLYICIDKFTLLFLAILFILPYNNTYTKEVTVIFKGQTIRFEKQPGSNELHGQINGMNIIATPHLNTAKNKNSYLGTFKKLNHSLNCLNDKRLVTYYVFEMGPK